jgi:hypothetical protein
MWVLFFIFHIILSPKKLKRARFNYDIELINICTVENEVIGFSLIYKLGNLKKKIPNPSNRTMALGLNQPLTEMSIRNIPGGKALPTCKADNLAAICELIV